ncbi:MAG: HyaD/HybD family hydrogenase maturation endopeptidase [Candidatus Saccharicenans sp.]|nr:HyaD/HybD family hydrogenase maturation endopeptidase [Candidatus Saccharicenans sp.]
MKDKIVVLGLGNILNRDEGAGVYALRKLEAIMPEDWKQRVELIEGGVLGLDLLPYVEKASRLLILDAVEAGGNPGEMVEFKNKEINTFFAGKISWHQLGFQEVLEVARVRGKYPEEVLLIGVIPGAIGIGLSLSRAVEKTAGRMAGRALEVLSGWLISTADKA